MTKAEENELTSAHDPLISVVVLSYNRPRLLREALASLVAQSCPRLDIMVVDNRSAASAEVAQVVAAYPQVRLVRNDANLGYAAGMNRGISLARAPYTYLTEDDIVLDADCLRRLVEYVESDAATALAAPIIYNREAGTIRCAGGELVLGGVYRRRTFGEGERDAGQFARPFHVTYLDGAALFARTSFLRQLGGFREEFFMYVEAVEFCARALKSGRRLTVVPAARVFHFEPASENDSEQFGFHRYKNLFALYLLHAPARCLPEFLARYALLGLLRSALAGKRGNTRTLARALLWVARRTPALVRERRGAGSPRVVSRGVYVND